MESTALRVLHVEDDDVDVEVLARSFIKARVANEVVVARDGVEALEILRGEAGHDPLPRPYIILLDLSMPRMTGHEFLRELRSDPELCDAVVFVLTTSSLDRDVFDSYQLNVAGYITKELAGQRFLEVVSQLSGYWRIAELAR